MFRNKVSYKRLPTVIEQKYRSGLDKGPDRWGVSQRKHTPVGWNRWNGQVLKWAKLLRASEDRDKLRLCVANATTTSPLEAVWGQRNGRQSSYTINIIFFIAIECAVVVAFI